MSTPALLMAVLLVIALSNLRHTHQPNEADQEA
jgi:hypothetical protein